MVSTSTVDFEILASGFGFVEAIRLGEDDTLYFSDFFEGGYFRKRPGSETETLLADRRWIGGAILNEDGSLLLSGEGGLIQLDIAGGGTKPLLTEIDGAPIDAINDMEADDEGGVYLGTVDFPALLDRGEEGKPGTLLRMDSSGALQLLCHDVAVSNGMGLSPDRRTFYHNDFPVGVRAYDMASGWLPHSPRLLVALDDADGLVVDCEGGIWIARCNAAEVVRYLPDGTCDQRITLPFPHVVSLAFGGTDLQQLYISTGGMDAAGQPCGAVIRIACPVPGQRANRGRIGMARV